MNDMQNELLKFYKKVKKVFDDNGIQFFAIAGTAIGAYREKGFIPWDDDIDIVVPEEDWEKFINVFSDSEFPLKDINGYSLYFWEKINSKEVFIEEWNRETNLFIDVFKGYKEREISYLSRKQIKFFDHCLKFKQLSLKHIRKEWNLGVVFWGIVIKMLPFSHKWSKKRVHKLISKSKITDETRVVPYFVPEFMTKIKMNINDSKIVKFEDSTIYITSNIKEELKEQYGDISQQPPANKRYSHGTHITRKINDKE